MLDLRAWRNAMVGPFSLVAHRPLPHNRDVFESSYRSIDYPRMEREVEFEGIGLTKISPFFFNLIYIDLIRHECTCIIDTLDGSLILLLLQGGRVHQLFKEGSVP